MFCREEGRAPAKEKAGYDDVLPADGAVVTCYVLEREGGAGCVELSLRPERINGTAMRGEEDVDMADGDAAPQEEAANLPPVGSIVPGFVVRTDGKGCFIRISRQLTARVLIKDLADGYVAEPSRAFFCGRFVSGRVTECDEYSGRVSLSLRPSAIVADERERARKRLKVGLVVRGTVASIAEFGVFVDLDGTAGLRGLCHKTEVASALSADKSSLRTHIVRGFRVD